jgi:hypothetical protein
MCFLCLKRIEPDFYKSFQIPDIIIYNTLKQMKWWGVAKKKLFLDVTPPFYPQQRIGL